MPTVVANRYARALADVVAPTGNYRQVLSELEDFGAAYHQSLELREVCETPAVTMAQKLSVLEALAGKMGTSAPYAEFPACADEPLPHAAAGGNRSRPSAMLLMRGWGLCESRSRPLPACLSSSRNF